MRTLSLIAALLALGAPAFAEDARRDLYSAQDKEWAEGDVAGALTLYRSAARSEDPRVNLPARLGVARCLRRTGKGEEARGVLDEMLAEGLPPEMSAAVEQELTKLRSLAGGPEPGPTEAETLRAELERARQEAALLRDSLADAAGNEEEIERLRLDLDGKNALVAELAKRLRSLAEKGVDPRELAERTKLTEYFLSQARTLYRQARFDEAREWVRHALEQDPTHAEAREMWSRLGNTLGDRERLVRDVLRILDLERRIRLEDLRMEVDALIAGGQESLIRGELDRAYAEFAECIALIDAARSFRRELALRRGRAKEYLDRVSHPGRPPAGRQPARRSASAVSRGGVARHAPAPPDRRVLLQAARRAAAPDLRSQGVRGPRRRREADPAQALPQLRQPGARPALRLPPPRALPVPGLGARRAAGPRPGERSPRVRLRPGPRGDREPARTPGHPSGSARPHHADRARRGPGGRHRERLRRGARLPGARRRGLRRPAGRLGRGVPGRPARGAPRGGPRDHHRHGAARPHGGPVAAAKPEPPGPSRGAGVARGPECDYGLRLDCLALRAGSDLCLAAEVEVERLADTLTVPSEKGGEIQLPTFAVERASFAMRLTEARSLVLVGLSNPFAGGDLATRTGLVLILGVGGAGPSEDPPTEGAPPGPSNPRDPQEGAVPVNLHGLEHLANDEPAPPFRGAALRPATGRTGFLLRHIREALGDDVLRRPGVSFSIGGGVVWVRGGEEAVERARRAVIELSAARDRIVSIRVRAARLSAEDESLQLRGLPAGGEVVEGEGVRLFVIRGEQRRRLQYFAAGTEGRIPFLSGVVVARNTQLVNVSRLTRYSFLREFRRDEDAGPQPVYDTLDEGIAVEVRPVTTGEGGIDLRLGVRVARILAKGAVEESGGGLVVERPVQAVSVARLRVTLSPEESLLVTGIPAPDSESDRRDRLVVLIDAVEGMPK